MLFLRIKEPALKWELQGTKEMTLWFQGFPTERLCVNHKVQEFPVPVTISSEAREEPYEVGSLLYEEAADGEAASMQAWVHATASDIEAMYEKSKGAKYVYMTIRERSLIRDRDWDLKQGNPLVIQNFDFRVSSGPCFGELADAEPSLPISTTALVQSDPPKKEPRNAKWLFWIVLWIALLLTYKVFA